MRESAQMACPWRVGGVVRSTPVDDVQPCVRCLGWHDRLECCRCSFHESVMLQVMASLPVRVVETDDRKASGWFDCAFRMLDLGSAAATRPSWNKRSTHQQLP